jgi:hypothetical protein
MSTDEARLFWELRLVIGKARCRASDNEGNLQSEREDKSKQFLKSPTPRPSRFSTVYTY